MTLDELITQLTKLRQSNSANQSKQVFTYYSDSGEMYPVESVKESTYTEEGYSVMEDGEEYIKLYLG